MSNQEIIQLALGLADTLEGAEALQVGTTHIGDEATGRLGRLYQRLDVARMRSTHLYDSNLRHIVQLEQRLGNTHIVVKITLRSHHAIALCQHGTNQFLGSGLAIRSRNANDRYIKLATMLAGQVFESLQTVVDEDNPLLIPRGGRSLPSGRLEGASSTIA